MEANGGGRIEERGVSVKTLRCITVGTVILLLLAEENTAVIAENSFIVLGKST